MKVEAGADEKQQIKFVWPYNQHFSFCIIIIIKHYNYFLHIIIYLYYNIK